MDVNPDVDRLPGLWKERRRLPADPEHARDPSRFGGVGPFFLAGAAGLGLEPATTRRVTADDKMESTTGCEGKIIRLPLGSFAVLSSRHFVAWFDMISQCFLELD